MCETAKIINLEKQVILPDINAGCSLADSASHDIRIQALKPLEGMLALR